MAIKDFKEIIKSYGYKVDSRDRKIFERNFTRTILGNNSAANAIEFVLYDSNDNKLPQGETGSFVRYIYFDDANLSEYFSVDSTIQNINGAPEYKINVEKLIKDAGYNNGIFKTQVTLINRRVGNETDDYNKLWIHEISPSRTEIRVLPIINNEDGTVNSDLESRYNIFTDNKNFKDDTLPVIQKFIQNINVQNILENVLKIKGSIKSGSQYLTLIKNEFKVDNFDLFLNNVKSKYIEAMTYFTQGKNFDINSLEYGSSRNNVDEIQLSIETIISVSEAIITNIIDFYLPKRNILEKSILSLEDQVTIDKLQDIFKTTTSDSIYESTIPESILSPVKGCTNPNAQNYNPTAVIDDGTCILNIPVDNDATVSDTISKTFYVWSVIGSIQYTDINGNHTWNGKEYDSVHIVYTDGSTPHFGGDIREYPKINTGPLNNICNDPNALNYGKIGECVYKPIHIDDKLLYEYPKYQTSSNKLIKL